MGGPQSGMITACAGSLRLPRCHPRLRRIATLADDRPRDGELALLGIAVAASTVWEILKTAGIEPSPQRATVTGAAFLRSQAEAILAMDFIETITLTGQRQYILAAIHHAGRRVRVVGTTAHPTHAWVAQAVRNLLMDLEGTDCLAPVRFLVRDVTASTPR